MAELNAKQEAIKKAYGEENYNFFKGIIGENGWIGLSRYDFEEDLESEKKFDKMIYEIEFEESFDNEQVFYRPKSLQGIENNNGWIRIESEADLPKEGMHHSILLDSECINGYRNYDVIVFYEVNSKFRKKEISHYQPIEEPLKPIY